MAMVMLFLRQTTGKTERYTHFCMSLKPVFTRDCGNGVHFIDEPTNGLDPAGMKHLRDLFKMLCTEYGITVVISSHMLSEVESIADTIGIIHHGEMMKEISIKEIAEMNTVYIDLSVEDVKKAAYILSDKLKLGNFKIVDEQNIRIYDSRITAKEISKELSLNDVGISSIGRQSESLEDYFLKITGEGAN